MWCVVLRAEGGDGAMNLLQPGLRMTHPQRGKIRVHPRTVPVPFDRLGGKGRDDAKALGDAQQQVARKAEMVRDGQRVGTFAVDASIADLKLPLARQDFRVDAVNHDARVDACPGMGFYDGPPEDDIPADAAVVRALRRGIPSRRGNRAASRL